MSTLDKNQMDQLIETAYDLRIAAETLLSQSGLPSVLKQYGTLHSTGSYYYDLMTWRDIDLCLSVSRIDIAVAFSIGKDIASLPGVGSMYYRNELVLRTAGNPEGIFWCIDLRDHISELWKIDVLISTNNVIENVRMPGLLLKQSLTAATRSTILKIKAELSKRPAYRREYRSTDIYRAVINAGVTNIMEWEH